MARIEKRKARGTGAIRRSAAVTAVSLLALAGQPAHADTAIVRQDATPIVSAPGVGGRVLARVDAGFPLTVVGRKGEWLRVASPQLKLPGELWVPAARVGDIVADPDDAALSDDPSSMATGPQFRITNMTDGMGTAPSGAAASIESRGSIGGSADVTGSTSSDDAALSNDPLSMEIGPQFRITNMTDGMGTAPSGAAASIESRGSIGGSVDVTRSTSSDAAGATVRATGAATRSTAAQATPDTTAPAESNPTPALGNPTPAAGNPTSAVGNPTQALGNPTPAAGNPTSAVGNPTSALGNPTPAAGNPTPALGNPTTALGNPTPAMGNQTPAMGSSVVGFGNSRTMTR